MMAPKTRRGFWKRSKPTITWYKDGKILLETERYVISNGQLTIQNLIDNDNGDYKCLAENPAGSQEYKTVLEVNSPPSIALGSQSISSLVNERVTLECQGEFKIFFESLRYSSMWRYSKQWRHERSNVIISLQRHVKIKQSRKLNIEKIIMVFEKRHF